MDKKQNITLAAGKLDKLKITWALIGKTNLALQGMFVQPKRIGIVTRDFNKEKVQNSFKEYEIVKSFILPNGEGEEIIYLVEGVEIQFCFEFEHGFYAKFLKSKKFEFISLYKSKIPCLKLEDEIKGYAYLGEKEVAEKIKEFLDNRISVELFGRIMDFAEKAYHQSNVVGQTFRPGGPMPYLAHPLFCATILANDRRLSLKERSLGFQTLVLHDIMEDTAEKLPKWVSPKVKELVKEMTFDSWEEKKKVIRKKSKFVKLLLLADSLANMYEETVGEHKRKEYKEQSEYLLQEAEKNYPNCRLKEIGRAIIENTNW